MSPIDSLPRVFLFRHGATEWSTIGRHTGRTDPPLTEQGEQDARRLGFRFRDMPFNRVFVSPRQRARRTCELVELNAPPEVDIDVAEWDYGDYEGRCTADIQEERPDWNLFLHGCPNGETPAEVAARADRVIARIVDLVGNIALFTHGHFGRMLGARWIGLAPEQARHLSLSTASVSILAHEHGKADEPALALWNAEASALCDPNLPLGDMRSMKQRALERWENEGGA
jgi:probable phosphoglycerate mutase